MAILKCREYRKNGSGIYDILHKETDASVVLMSDGSTSVQSAIESKQAQHIATTITIVLSDWSNLSCQKTVVGVTANNTIFVAPTATYQNTYSKAKIKCSAQADDLLTFTCETLPTTTVEVNIVILDN